MFKSKFKISALPINLGDLFKAMFPQLLRMERTKVSVWNCAVPHTALS